MSALANPAPQRAASGCEAKRGQNWAKRIACIRQMSRHRKDSGKVKELIVFIIQWGGPTEENSDYKLINDYIIRKDR